MCWRLILVPYHKQYKEMLYGLEQIDYREFPLNFDRYSRADQTRIARRMLAVLEASQRGIDLETGPFPDKEIGLDEAVAQLEVLTAKSP